MIDYVEIRDANLSLVGIIDTFKSLIWNRKYYSVGRFEIYTAATDIALSVLGVDNYVSLPNTDDIGVIESIQIIDNAQDGRMIVAAGRMAKSILDRRIIYKLSGNSNAATTLYGNVESEVREVVNNNAIDCTDANRNIPLFELGALSNLPAIIIQSDSTTRGRLQVSHDGLLDYTDALLMKYQYGAKVILNRDASKLQYVVFSGTNHSMLNAEGNTPLVFSSEFDNLTETKYTYDSSILKNTALVGGEGEGTARFHTLIDSSFSGLARREVWFDKSGISKTDENETEYTDEEYAAILNTEGTKELAAYVPVQQFTGSIDLTNSNLILGVDYDIGDVVTVQDVALGIQINSRITETTEVQDDGGYIISVNFD